MAGAPSSTRWNFQPRCARQKPQDMIVQLYPGNQLLWVSARPDSDTSSSSTVRNVIV